MDGSCSPNAASPVSSVVFCVTAAARACGVRRAGERFGPLVEEFRGEFSSSRNGGFAIRNGGFTIRHGGFAGFK